VFFSPGLQHCYAGAGGFPDASFDVLREWVEKDDAPETLNSTSLPDADGNILHRPLCLYPKQQYYGGGDPAVADSFYCE
jgi:hypothetical protein